MVQLSTPWGDPHVWPLRRTSSNGCFWWQHVAAAFSVCVLMQDSLVKGRRQQLLRWSPLQSSARVSCLSDVCQSVSDCSVPTTLLRLHDTTVIIHYYRCDVHALCCITVVVFTAAKSISYIGLCALINNNIHPKLNLGRIEYAIFKRLTLL